MKKEITCELTGKTVMKRKSKVVAGRRVAPESVVSAKSILISAVNVFLEEWSARPHTPKNRLNALAYCAAIINSCREHHAADPTAFVVEIAQRASDAGQELHEAFIKKLLDYSEGELAYEFTLPHVKKAIESGFEVLEYAIYQALEKDNEGK